MSVPDLPAAASPPKPPWWLWFNVLSLDAPLLAVLWQWALAQYHQVVLLPGCYWALGLAVWLIYITDRTLDGFGKVQPGKQCARHHFYRKYRWVFALGAGPAALVWLLWISLTQIPSGILWRGVGLGFLVALYLIHFAARAHRVLFLLGNVLLFGLAGGAIYILHLPDHLRLFTYLLLGALFLTSLARAEGPRPLFLPKELICGYLFAVGCSISVQFYTLGSPVSAFYGVETLLLALLFTLNGIAIAGYERRQDDESRYPDTMAQNWPAVMRVYPLLLASLAGAAVTMWVRMGSHGAPPREMVCFVVAILLSTTLLGMLHTFARRISPELAHVLADVALVTPVLFFLIH